jgi:hypothetical protein
VGSSIRAAAAVFAFATGILAGTAWAEREWPSARLLCDSRGNVWERDVVACPANGTAYPDDGKRRDGIVVELRGVTYTVDKNGFPQTAIDYFWFREDGSYVERQKPVFEPVVYPGKGIPLAVQPGDTFTGRMLTLPSRQIGPGVYTILFQARVPCTFSPGEYCNSPTREIPLPPEFKPPDPKGLPPNLRYGTGATRSEFAWARIRILDGARPDPAAGAFRLVCRPEAGACVAGSRFEIKTAGGGVPLQCGGPIKFYKEGDSLPWQVMLYDAGGAPVFGSKQGRFDGFGNMPGAGKWKAYVTCVGEPPILLGEYVLPEAPKPPPPPPRVVPVKHFDLAFRIGRKTLPKSYNAPYPAFGEDEVYPGMELQLKVAQPAGWNPYSDREPQRYDILLDGEKLLMNSAYAWDTYLTVPASLPAGPHRIALHAEHFVEGKKIEFDGARQVIVVGTPEHPRLSVRGSVETGAEASGTVAPVAPGMEVERLEVIGVGNTPYPVEASSAAADGRIDLKFLVPLDRIWGNVLENGKVAAEKQILLAATFRQKVGQSEWHRFRESYPVRMGIVCRGAVDPRLEVSPATLVLRPGSSAALKVTGFPCGDRVRVFSEGEGGERIDWGLERVLGPTGEVEGDAFHGSDALEVRPVEERVKARAPQPLVFLVKGESGREARREITVTPPTYIEVIPRTPKVGQWIRVQPFGFAANAYAHLYLGEAPLTHGYGKPLEAGQPLDIRLPEGVAGRKTVRLADNAGNEAETAIEIEGEGFAEVCVKPCVQLPPQARQGEPFDAGIGGFERNEQLIVRFDELFEVGKPYQRDLLVKESVRVPRDLPDGRYRVTASALNNPARSAFSELEIGGGHVPPTVEIPCPKDQPLCLVPRFRPGESVRTKGIGWMTRGRFRAVLYPVQGKAQKVETYREGCAWEIGDRPQGTPCDEEKGEIDKFWVMRNDLSTGPWAIEVTDGIAAARAEFRIEAAETNAGRPAEKPVDQPVEKPGDKVAEKPADKPSDKPANKTVAVVTPPPPGRVLCNPDIAKIWQAGCVEPGEVGGGDASPPPTKAICDPNRPRYAQKGCVEPDAPADAGGEPRAPTKCNPSVPMYQQRGCIP